MRNVPRRIVIIVLLVFLLQVIFFGSIFAEVWTQTSQSDFDAGIKINTETISDPGNVTLSQM